MPSWLSPPYSALAPTSPGLLQFYPAPARKPIRETNVERLMRLGDKYHCADVIVACEQYLLQVGARLAAARRTALAAACCTQTRAAGAAPGSRCRGLARRRALAVRAARPSSSSVRAPGPRAQVALPAMERGSSSDPAAVEHSRTRMFEWMSMAQSHNLAGLEAKCAGGAPGWQGAAGAVLPVLPLWCCQQSALCGLTSGAGLAWWR